MTDYIAKKLQRERPIYHKLKGEIGEALHILVGALALKKKNISPKNYEIMKEQVKRVMAVVEETAGMMQPPLEWRAGDPAAKDAVRH